MIGNKDKKVITLSILVGAILLISIGFAAFNSILNINTTATVTPDSNSFKIKFSKESGSVKDGSSNPITPIKTGDITAEDAIIDNDNTDGPTIENLNATFKAPGDSVKYEFYVLNETAFDAYLTKVLYNGTPFKDCIAGTGADETLVSNACDTIVVKITIGSSEFTATTTSGITNVLTKQTGSQPTSEKVTIEITYNGPARADGPFEVTLGDIELVYSTVQSSDGTDSDSGEDESIMEIYRFSSEEVAIGDNIENITYETTPENISQSYYLKHEVVNNVVTASYACITYTENEIRKDVCLRGGDTYASIQEILSEAEPYFSTLAYGSSSTGYGYCDFYDSYSHCYSDSFHLNANSAGTVTASGGSGDCGVTSDGYSRCSSW